MREASLKALQDLLQAAALDPSPGNLALAVLLLSVVPLSMVVPMTAGCVAVALTLPPPAAFGVMLAGLLANTALAWGIARVLGAGRLAPWMERRGGAFAFLREAARERPFQAAFLSRFIPAPFALTPMAAAAAGLGLGPMLLGTLAAMTPWSVAYVAFARAGRQGSLGALGLALGALALAVMLAVYFKRRAGPRRAQEGR